MPLNQTCQDCEKYMCMCVCVCVYSRTLANYFPDFKDLRLEKKEKTKNKNTLALNFLVQLEGSRETDKFMP